MIFLHTQQLVARLIEKSHVFAHGVGAARGLRGGMTALCVITMCRWSVGGSSCGWPTTAGSRPDPTVRLLSGGQVGRRAAGHLSLVPLVEIRSHLNDGHRAPVSLRNYTQWVCTNLSDSVLDQ